jgi:hypothetical protein
LIECNPDPSIIDCAFTANAVGTHYYNGGPGPFPDGPGGTCEIQIITNLIPCGKARYSCCILDGPGGTQPGFPTEDAFIEWFWAIEYTDNSTITHFITGKFTFCASASFIFNTWRANGNSYINPAGFGYGIPMFNPSNHNVQ